MAEIVALEKLLTWLKESGRSKAWFARQVGYSYQTAWGKLSGTEPLTDRFVTACFEWVEGLPWDVFEARGYFFDGEMVLKKIPVVACQKAAGK